MEWTEAPEGQEVAPEHTPEAPEEEPQMTMEDLLAEEGFSLEFPHTGEIRKGVITSITDNEVLVGIGAKSEGVIPKRDLERLSDEEREAIQAGNEISVYVMSVDGDGTAKLSYTRALEAEDWDKAEAMRDAKETFQGVIAGVNKGGLVVRFGRLRGFIPASQVSRERRLSVGGGRPDKDLEAWKALIGQPIAVRVIEVDRERRRLILSERAAARESREMLKEQLLDALQVGDVRTGRVTSLTNFGAFVNIDGADGLVHLSEISWERVGKAGDVLTVGQEVTVKVIEVDRDRKRIGLSIRQLQEDPWQQKVKGLREGLLVSGVITRLEKFGAFARLENGLEGLIHISELSDQHVEHPREVVSEGDEVTLRIVRIDPERRRIGLSLRKVDSLAYADLDLRMALEEAEELLASAEDDAEAAVAEEAADAADVVEAVEAEAEEAADAAEAVEAAAEAEAEEAAEAVAAEAEEAVEAVAAEAAAEAESSSEETAEADDTAAEEEATD